jgi:hypothetical protein
VTDTLPEGLEFVSASVTGGLNRDSTCFKRSTGNEVTCFPVAFNQDTPFVATIEVIPRQCGTFTNTVGGIGLSVSETFTVVQCVPMTKLQCKKGGWSNLGLGWPDQGTCISAVNQNRP